MNRCSSGIAISIGLLTLVATSSADDLRWRVSVKVIVDSNDERSSSGNFNTDAEIQAAYDNANALLAAHRSPFAFDVIEIVDLTGKAEWFSAPVNGTTRSALETAAEANPTGYLLRDDAINVYILAGGTGWCARPFGNEPYIYILGQSANIVTPLHEAGHILGLCHSHGCVSAGSSCSVDPCTGFETPPPADEISDTIPDKSCWSEDQIACYNYGDTYANLTPLNQDNVDDVWRNVMSYHDPANRSRFTTDQLDVLYVTSNMAYDHAASGYVWFVGGPSVITPNGLVWTPEPTISNALALAQITTVDDVILVRGGNYPAITIDQNVCLRASRGNAIIGQP